MAGPSSEFGPDQLEHAYSRASGAVPTTLGSSVLGHVCWRSRDVSLSPDHSMDQSLPRSNVLASIVVHPTPNSPSDVSQSLGPGPELDSVSEFGLVTVVFASRDVRDIALRSRVVRDTIAHMRVSHDMGNVFDGTSSRDCSGLASDERSH